MGQNGCTLQHQGTEVLPSLLHDKMVSNENVVHLTFFILNLKYKTKFRIKAILNFDNLCCNMSFNGSWLYFFVCWVVYLEVYLQVITNVCQKSPLHIHSNAIMTLDLGDDALYFCQSQSKVLKEVKYLKKYNFCTDKTISTELISN